MTGDKFEADPRRLAAFAEEFKSTRREFDKAREDFLRDERRLGMWMGDDPSDTYAKQVKPPYDQGIEQTTMLFEMFGEAVDNIGEIIFGDAKDLSDFQGENVEGFHGLGSSSDGIGPVGGGRF
ncbi:hypothetical protein [Streptomyces bohaiensis]|uniref:WXG100 family type VII secretion target n=1 Tax=Streptomyces bohaiensis TaxID=1431344 RepID=A0ABX1CA51_9ACTN|nr:hypothetical protein [Streptomyces bohaiensis]NJQ16007.1 hypothetical protein [Streptomyces bohaiensis]